MIHVLLDGEVIVTERRPAAGERQRPGVARASWKRCSRSRCARTVRTTGIAVTLALTAEELRTQLAYNPELVRGLFATMADAGRQQAGMQQVFPTGAAARARTARRWRPAAGRKGPGDRARADLRAPLAGGGAHLADHHAHGRDEGRDARCSRRPIVRRTWLILSGEVDLEADDAASRRGRARRRRDRLIRRARPARRIGRNARVTRAGIALRHRSRRAVRDARRPSRDAAAAVRPG